LAIAGAFDDYGVNRSSYVTEVGGIKGIDLAVKFGAQAQSDELE